MTSLIEQALDLAGWSDAWLHELRGPHGEWIKTGTVEQRESLAKSVHTAHGPYKMPPHDRLINERSRQYPDPASHPFFKKYPPSHVNIEHAFDVASPGQLNQGMRWYPDSGLLAGGIAHGDDHLGGGLLSAYSPQTSWPVNMFNAARSVELGRAIGPGEGTTVMGSHQRAAQKIMDGKSYEETFSPTSAPKTYSFAKLIGNHGEDAKDDPYGDAVIDRHAVSVACGQRISDEESPPIGDARFYNVIADEYRQAAINLSHKYGFTISPSQVQAVTWLVQQAANEAEDAEAAKLGHLDPAKARLAKGRVTRTRNAWAQWTAYAGANNLPVKTGTTALSMMYEPEFPSVDNPGILVDLALLDHFNPAEARNAHGEWMKVGTDGKVSYTGNLGIDRKEMPQLSGMVKGQYKSSGEMLPKFFAHLRSQGVEVTHERVDPASLKPTQTGGSMDSIQGIADQIRSGKLTDVKPITVSSDSRVLDGHHTWAAYRLAGHDIPVSRVHLPIGELLNRAREFARSEGIESRATGEVANPKYRELPVDSLAKHTGPDGEITAERAALHKQIVDKILEGHQPQEHPVATFFGGGSASGKSSLKASTPDNAKIDADAIKEQLPEYRAMNEAGDKRAAAYAHEESSLIAKQAQREAERRRINYILDGTGNNSYSKMTSKVAAARAAGYGINAHYVTVDTDEAVRRAMKRAEHTGRMVPETVIRGIHAGVSGVFRQAVQNGLFDRAELLDNNGSGAARRIAYHDKGQPLQVTDPEAWQRFLAKEREDATVGSSAGKPAGPASGQGLPSNGRGGYSGNQGGVGLSSPRPGEHAARRGTGDSLGVQRGATLLGQLELAGSLLGQAGVIELRYNPLEPRDDHGRWTKGSSAVSEAASLIREAAGASAKPGDGSFGSPPDDPFMQRQRATRDMLVKDAQRRIQWALNTPPEHMSDAEVSIAAQVLASLTPHDYQQIRDATQKVVPHHIARHVTNRVADLADAIKNETNDDTKQHLITHLAVIAGALALSFITAGLGAPAGIAALIGLVPPLAQEYRDYKVDHKKHPLMGRAS